MYDETRESSTMSPSAAEREEVIVYPHSPQSATAHRIDAQHESNDDMMRPVPAYESRDALQAYLTDSKVWIFEKMNDSREEDFFFLHIWEHLFQVKTNSNDIGFILVIMEMESEDVRERVVELMCLCAEVMYYRAISDEKKEEIITNARSVARDWVDSASEVLELHGECDAEDEDDDCEDEGDDAEDEGDDAEDEGDDDAEDEGDDGDNTATSIPDLLDPGAW